MKELGKAFADIYKGKNLLWQIFAGLITYVAVVSGFDWFYYESFVNTPAWLLLPGATLGALIPIIAPILVIAFGTLRKNLRTINTGWALGQAAILGLFISSAYKVFTGRIPPPRAYHYLAENFSQTAVNVSQGFQLGFFRGGIFWGWPSSHATIAFAMGAALFALYPDKKILRLVGIIWAIYVAIAVSMSIHWFSEAISGVIFGSIIGLAVGKIFKNKTT